jgi:ABC-type phosphate transport system substrate-binding protein
MRFRKNKSARTGLRAALLAGATVAAIGVGGLGASGAAAAPLCTGGNIIGQGASLQKVAQQNVWIPKFQTEVCNSGKFPTVTYESTGSGAGLKEWNADGAKGSLNHERLFISTDDAPTTEQINNIKSVAGGSNVLVIPVAQTAIAIVANPPAGCTVENITNPDLEKVFRGQFLTWNQLGTDSGTCNSPITRVVRLDGSGTTYQFKNYLSLANTKGLACTTGGTEGKASWKELQPITNTETGAPNTTWPVSCEGTTLSTLTRPAKTGGGEVVKTVNATEGSIGYASLPDAKANSAKVILNVGNNGQKGAAEATFGNPVDPGKAGVANCGSTTYVVPENARKLGTALDVDWSKVFGANAAIGGTAYPLCTLTYELAFNKYSLAGFLNKYEVTTKDYIREYQVFKGQEDLDASGTFYASLPTSAKSLNDVLGAAKFAAGKINF